MLRPACRARASRHRDVTLDLLRRQRDANRVVALAGGWSVEVSAEMRVTNPSISGVMRALNEVKRRIAFWLSCSRSMSCGLTLTSTARRVGLLAQKHSPQLLMFAEAELGLGNRRVERLREILLRDRPGSLDRRVCRDAADCSDADDRDSDCNDHSRAELPDAAAHGRSPSFGWGAWCAHGGMITPARSNRPVIDLTAAQSF
jgi:hypothetical protein